MTKLKGDDTLQKLAEAWNEYIKEYGHSENPQSWYNDDTNDFRKVIHEAERIVLAKQSRELRP